MFELTPLKLGGAFIVRGKLIHDERGFFCKTLHRDFFAKHGLEWKFAEQYYSQSQENVIRGLHFQSPPFEHTKLVHCVAGSSLDVLVDLRKNSPTFGAHVSVELDAQRPVSVYAPPGLAHGFLAKSQNTIMMYSVTSTYNREYDGGILWNSVDFDWGIEAPILSERDRSFVPFNDFVTPFTDL
jgi:dTDP-4-dehydrorhamnose 3,5-epimerase